MCLECASPPGTPAPRKPQKCCPRFSLGFVAREKSGLWRGRHVWFNRDFLYLKFFVFTRISVWFGRSFYPETASYILQKNVQVGSRPASGLRPIRTGSHLSLPKVPGLGCGSDCVVPRNIHKKCSMSFARTSAASPQRPRPGRPLARGYKHSSPQRGGPCGAAPEHWGLRARGAGVALCSHWFRASQHGAGRSPRCSGPVSPSDLDFKRLIGRIGDSIDDVRSPRQQTPIVRRIRGAQPRGAPHSGSQREINFLIVSRYKS